MLPTIKIKFERWKWNEDYGVYVSTLGRIKDARKKLVPIVLDRGGYCMALTNPRKEVAQHCHGYARIHRLVLLTWRPVANVNELTVDHLDHNKRNNELSNLEWVTEKENQKRGAQDYLPAIVKAAQSVGANKNAVSGAAVKKIEIEIIGDHLPMRKGEVLTSSTTDASIIMMSKSLDEKCRNDQFSRSTFNQYCRDIVSGKNPSGKKLYFGFEIRGVKE
jgi:hypothetical protein